MKKLLLILLGLLTILPTFARTFTYEYEGQTLTYTVLDEDAKTCEVSSGLTVSGDLKIPAGCRDNDNVRFSVIGIGDKAFRNCSLTSIRIPNSVTYIGNYAFDGCTELTSVTIPDGVTSIGDGTFSDCFSLTSVSIPDGVTSIGDGTFSDCFNLTSVSIPKSVTSIGEDAFYGCTGLKKAEFASIVHLCSIEFSDKDSNPLSQAHHLYIGGMVITEVVIPESVTSIGKYAFYGSTGLKKAKFASIEHLCSIKFGNAYSNPLSAAHHLYIGGKEITEVVIPESVTSIGYAAFSGCTGLTSVTIPESVTSIGMSAFSDCTGLTSITIPGSVTEIGRYAFNGCTSLTSVTIPDGMTSIGEYAFYYCTGLTSVTIPESVTSICEYAFYHCTGLTSVTIPKSVTSIGEGAFCQCYGLTSVTIPEGVTSIGRAAFRDCFSLTSVTIPDGVTSIGERAFYNCSSLASVTIPESVTYIGEEAWSGCDKIEEVKCFAMNPVECTEDIFTQAVYDNAVLYIPVGSIEHYEEVNPWKHFYDIRESLVSGIEEIAIEVNESEISNMMPAEVFDLNGSKISDSMDNLPKGIYILRQGNKTSKIAVK